MASNNTNTTAKFRASSATLNSQLLASTPEYTALYNFFSDPEAVLRILPANIDEIKAYFAEYRRLVEAYERVNGPVWAKELQERGPAFWEQRCLERAEDEATEVKKRATVVWEQLPSIGGQVAIGGLLPIEEGDEENKGEDIEQVCKVM